MDGITPITVFEDESAHTSGRKSARSGRLEVLVRADRRRSWTAEQKRQIVSESLEPDVTPADVARRLSVALVISPDRAAENSPLRCGVRLTSALWGAARQ